MEAKLCIVFHPEQERRCQNTTSLIRKLLATALSDTTVSLVVVDLITDRIRKITKCLCTDIQGFLIFHYFIWCMVSDFGYYQYSGLQLSLL